MLVWNECRRWKGVRIIGTGDHLGMKETLVPYSDDSCHGFEWKIREYKQAHCNFVAHFGPW